MKKYNTENFLNKLFLIFSLILLLKINPILAKCQNNDTQFENNIEIISNSEDGLWSKDKSKKLRIEEILRIGVFEGDENYILGNVKDIALNQNGDIFINDIAYKCIKVYDPAGNFLRKIGREGQGPGEFLNNTNIEFDQSDHLYVLDFISNRRITKFNSDGKFINSYKLPFYKQTGLVEFKINTKNEIITSFVPVLPRENYTNILTHFNEHFKIVRKYGSPNFLYEHAYGKTYSQPHIDLSSNGDIYCAFHYPYLINVYREGKLLKIIKRDCSNFTKFSWIIQNGLPIKQPVTRSLVQKIFCLPNGAFIVIIRDSGEDYIEKYESTNAYEPIEGVKTYLDLFDVEGRFLKSYLFERDTYGSIIHVDRDGFFYTNSKDVIPMLVKYKITFN